MTAGSGGVQVRRRASLRRRLALSTGAAVAGSVLLVSLASWILVRNELRSRVDDSLRSAPVPTALDVTAVCAPPVDGTAEVTLVLEAIYPTGAGQPGYCASVAKNYTVPRPTDLDVLTTGRVGDLHDATTRGGEHVRVLTKPVTGGQALMLIRPLTETDRALERLALALLLVSATGGVVATFLGRTVARGVLRPVEELTVTAEHVARTQNLAVRIGAQGTVEMARLADAFTSMTAALSQSREDQRRLIQDAGHELRTPLTSLKTNVELLIRSEAHPGRLPAADRATLLADLSGQTDELATLIEELTVLARQADGPGAVEAVAFDEVVRRALERVERRGPGIDWQVDVSPWQVQGSPSMLERAVVNLLDNAVKFSPSSGRITVRLRGGVLDVTDSGPGIAETDLAHVFDRFWRSPDARGLPGSGLGLAIVAMTAQQHGGDVAVTNHRDATGAVTGARARLRLPGEPSDGD